MSCCCHTVQRGRSHYQRFETETCTIECDPSGTADAGTFPAFTYTGFASSDQKTACASSRNALSNSLYAELFSFVLFAVKYTKFEWDKKVKLIITLINGVNLSGERGYINTCLLLILIKVITAMVADKRAFNRITMRRDRGLSCNPVGLTN